MSRTVNGLLFSAYRLIQGLGRDEKLEGTKLTEGIDVLNDLLALYSNVQQYMPIFDVFSFNTTANKSSYTVSTGTSFDIVHSPINYLDDAFYDLNNGVKKLIVRPYNLFYFDGRRLDTVAPPEFILNEYFDSYSKLTLFPSPNSSYKMTIRTKKLFTEQTNDQTLSGVPDNYFMFLKYALARELAPMIDQDANWTAYKEKIYSDLRRIVEADSMPDLDVVVEAPNLSSWRNGCCRHDMLRNT